MRELLVAAVTAAMLAGQGDVHGAVSLADMARSVMLEAVIHDGRTGAGVGSFGDGSGAGRGGHQPFGW